MDVSCMHACLGNAHRFICYDFSGHVLVKPVLSLLAHTLQLTCTEFCGIGRGLCANWLEKFSISLASG